MAKYDYKGTKITGTSTTAHVVKKSGVKKAKKGDLYFNKSTGHVYKCTNSGEPDKAKWKYIRTDIASKPDTAVSKLASPARQSGNRVMKATWSVPSALTNEKKGDRAEELEVRWWLGISGSPSIVYERSENATSSSINLDALTIGKTKYTRDSFYPRTKTKLTSVTVRVRPHNSKGYGPAAKMSRTFTAPAAPVISGMTFNKDTGVVSGTITTDAGAGHAERYDTRYRITIVNTRTKQTYVYKDATDKATSIPFSFNASDYQEMNPDKDYIRVKVEAWARGYAGETAATPKNFYVSYPKPATIRGIDVSGRTSADRCTVKIKTNSSTEHPVDVVKLEYLADVEYATAEEIPGTVAWSSTDIVDDASCTALTMPVADLIPDKGHYTWVRVLSWHANEDVLKRYSEYWTIEALETPASTAEDDYVAITDHHRGPDGKSIVVQLGWDADGKDDSTGTELSWSDEPDTWRSTKAPDSYEFSWEDTDETGRSVPVTYEGVTYRRSATITIKGLEEGEKYYIRARRYYEGDVTTYSPYSNMVTEITSEIPETVSAICERYVPSGSSLQVNWVLAGNGIQKEWKITDSNGTELASGQGSLGSGQIEADKLASVAVDGNVTFRVHASAGSGYIDSEEHTVTIIDPPTLALNVPSTLTAQPFSFTATVSRPSDLVIIVSSQGAVGQYPEGIKRQTSGDTIYSTLAEDITWTASGTELTTSITLPGGLDFWDKGLYTVEVTAIDRDTKLRSDPNEAPFSVSWATPAPSIRPVTTYSLTADEAVIEDKAYYTYDSETGVYTDIIPEGTENPKSEGWYEQTVTNFVTLTPVDEVDEAGVHHQAVQITLTPPAGASETDLYDIYRKVGYDTYLIGQGFPLTHITTDEYAPFGEDMTLEYRVAIRTIDGDVSFEDFEYVLEGSAMRFDWSDGSLELPYNISLSDSYKKDVDVRHHMDGSMDGYWNEGVERNGSLSSDVIRIEQQEEIDLARKLAKYAGPVFVRTPDGSAYEADVQVSDMSTKGRIMAVAIDATEIGLTAEFSLPVPHIGE